ncbi:MULTISPECIES: MaoC family dehydratase [Methylotenera]|uniref:MaoC family dehydratase n=1 Tax=Methylotenera TaxID=359407 RepID=UPI00036EF55B|nr:MULTISPECIES: MaoC family dehydratase [Methylotenera]
MQSTKTHNGRFFEDFTLNEVIQHATPRTISAGDCSIYIALYGSRNPLFCSEPFAQSLGYKTAPVDDLLAFHIAFGKTVPDISVNAVANLGYADVRFIQPVFVGDTLSTSSQVIGLKQNSNGKSGVVWVRSTAHNQHNHPVLSWVRWVMVHKNNLDLPAPETTTPELPTFVAPENLSLPSRVSAKNFDSKITGGQYYWEDYQVGERINHAAGLTINDSDHSLATHLYQNNARLHFDDFLMKNSNYGKRLVYGGVAISMCRSLSFDGLENAISVLAINAGTHANPTFAGDTIYCATEVLDTWQLTSSDFGALRLRMVGIKNMSASDVTEIKTDKGYHPNVVLDLDYTVAIPKKGNH